jgi:hypothetical protein
MRAIVQEVFQKVFTSEFRSFGGYDKNPMIYLKQDNNYGDTYLRAEVKNDGDDTILGVKFSVSDNWVSGDPIEVFMEVVDEFPNQETEFYQKELAKRGVRYQPDKMGDEVFSWIEPREEESSPLFEYNKIAVDPKASHKDLIEEFERWVSSISWAKPKKSILNKKGIPYSERVRNVFYKDIKQL